MEEHKLPLPQNFDRSRLAAYEGKDVVLGIRPENFHELAPGDIDPANTAPSTLWWNWQSPWVPRCISTSSPAGAT